MTKIERVYIDRAVAFDPLVEQIVTRLAVPATVIDDADTLFKALRSSDDPISSGKQALHLTQNKGAFIRKCPGTRHYACCDYMILHIGTFCTMDCAYCILQSYFHPPVLQFFVNQSQLFQELGRFFDSRTHRRIGTGEYTDSMIWERWTDLSRKLIPAFASQSQAVLELKTKTAQVDALGGLTHNHRTIMAWSVNTPEVMRCNERGTASLDARLEAAFRCQQWGYPLAFHFDPIVDYAGCQEDYQRVVDRIFDRIAAENIVWISLGTLRFMPDLKTTIQARWPRSRIPYGEFITGLDGKSRYLKHIRIDIYKGIVEAIRKRSAEVTVYFCMESDEIWENVLGFTPERFGGLPHLLDTIAIEKCGLDP